MKPFLLLISFQLVCILSFGQRDAKVYPDLASFLNNDPVIVDYIQIKAKEDDLTDLPSVKEHILISKKWPIADMYIIKSSQFDIQSNSVVVEYNDSTYVNCRSLLKVKGFAHVLFRSPKYLCFMAPRSKIVGGVPPYNNKERVAKGFVVGGLAGAIFASKADPESLRRFDYLYDLESKRIVYFNRPVMKRYISEASPETDADFIAFATELLALREEQQNYLYNLEAQASE